MFVLLLVGSVSPSTAAGPQPDAVVRKLYHEVVTRQLRGIPYGADKTVIWPFLSKELIGKFEMAQACVNDYYRQHPPVKGKILKPTFGWGESGLFYGKDMEYAPSEAVVERAEPQKDGSFYVYVQFMHKDIYKPYGRPAHPATKYRWDVAAVVISEGGRFVVDDVLFFKEDSTEIESRLSSFFDDDCKGSRWIGDRAPAAK